MAAVWGCGQMTVPLQHRELCSLQFWEDEQREAAQAFVPVGHAGAGNFASSFLPAPSPSPASPLLLLKQQQRMEVISVLGDPGLALGQHDPTDK